MCMLDWLVEVQCCGVGEIVLNCMDSDGVCCGYDVVQLCQVCVLCQVLLIVFGGVGDMQYFVDVFDQVDVDGVLVVSVFYSGVIVIFVFKQFLCEQQIEVCDVY